MTRWLYIASLRVSLTIGTIDVIVTDLLSEHDRRTDGGTQDSG